MSDTNSHAVSAPKSDAHFQAYLKVFYALCVLTAVSFITNALLGHGMAAFLIIMAVAIVKAVQVALVFMHLNHDWPKLYCIIIPVCVMGVMMMIVLLPDIEIGRASCRER